MDSAEEMPSETLHYFRVFSNEQGHITVDSFMKFYEASDFVPGV